LASICFLFFACSQKWLYINNPETYLTGFESTVTNNPFGKPGKLHVALGVLSAILFLTPRVWAKRTNLVFTALNLAWAMRNFFAIGLSCRGGICPTPTWAIYAVFISSILIFIMSLLPKLAVPVKKD
jgi:hypothetical protein